MLRRKPKAIYRTLFTRAWRTAWERKPLWVFGALAGFAATGGVFEVAYRSLHRITRARTVLEELVSGTLPGYDQFVEYLLIVKRVEPWRMNTVATLAVIVVLLFIALAVWSQSAMLVGLLSKKALSPSQCLARGRAYFWRLLGIDAIGKALIGIALIVTTLPLVLFVTESTMENAVLYSASFVLFFPAIIFTAIVINLATIIAIKKNRGIFHAVEDAYHLARKNWLVTLEAALLLFLLSLFVAFAGMVAFILVSAALTAILVAAVLTGSSLVYMFAVGGALTILSLLTLLTHGLILTFQTAVWISVYEKIASRNGLLAKLERLWSAW